MELIVATTIMIVIEEITIYQNEYEMDSFGMPEKIPEIESKPLLVLTILCLGIPAGVRIFIRWGKYIISLFCEHYEPRGDKCH